VAGVIARAWLAEDAAFESYDSVSRENDCWADGASGGKFGFGVSEALDEHARGFAGERSFVDGGSDDNEGEAGIVKDFGAARRSRSENEFHFR
jgi:hypothetical protein